MGLAKLVDAPVLLVGDIDRGGVFASLYGTVKLLEADEQARIKGLIINKFRGDPEILKPGVRMMEELVNIPVVGVVPMEKIDIDDEDSLSDHLLAERMTGGLDVAVIRLPHISNFTDFTAFERMPGVSLRYVDKASKLGRPHLILLPGTKNTMADLRWMRNNGLEEGVIRFSREGGTVFGVCGGYQMMGSMLSDPDGVEDGGTMAGMGLFPSVTVFREEKTRTRICGKVLCGALVDCPVEGYEIHMGDTRMEESEKAAEEFFPWIQLEDGRRDGIINRAGTVMGTYLHGIFDGGDFLGKLLIPLMKKYHLQEGDAGMPELDLKAYKEAEYDKLADLVRRSLDMDMIYQIIGGKPHA
jgi:adenosylcobyric acid synthase